MEIKKIEGFTPGPWEVVEGKHDHTTHFYDAGETWFNVRNEENVLADVVHGRCLDTDEEDARANAALIAYAPEMYSMLHEADQQTASLTEGIKELIEFMSEPVSRYEALEKAKQLLNK